MPDNRVTSWVLYRNERSGKVYIEAIDFQRVMRIDVTAKPSGQTGKDKRGYLYILTDGSTYEPPVDAELISAPEEHADLLAVIARHLVI